jgi:formylglycine-generating enzyme required for sulfatase activity
MNKTGSMNPDAREHPLPGNTISMPFRRIPAGSFMMGDCQKSSPEPDTRPAHRVTIDEFWCGIHPVTNAQYRAFVDATGYLTMRERARPERPFWNEFAEYEAHPVIGINWLDAAAFCQWAGLRLMTEAEWEYAARGGLEGAEFPWGNEPAGDRCNWRSARKKPSLLRFSDWGGLTPVDSYAPNGYGLFDMSGNVWEWVSDAYRPDYYRSSPASNPRGPASDYRGTASPAPDWSLPDAGIPANSYRVSRGGCWENQDFGIRVCERIFARASTRNKPHVGSFRCALRLGK